MSLEAALTHLRAGNDAEATASAESLGGFARMRFDMAFAFKSGDNVRALDLAARLWHAHVVDPTVISILVQLDHPELRRPAAEMLRRFASDVAYDVTTAWEQLARRQDDLDAWRDVISHLIVTGRSVEAVAGVAHAMSERLADFSLWAQLATLQLNYRQRDGILATLELGRQAFPHAPEVHATAAMVFLGLDDVDSARDELDAIVGAPESPLVNAARTALARFEDAR